jgi:hypothetical protein
MEVVHPVARFAMFVKTQLTVQIALAHITVMMEYV